MRQPQYEYRRTTYFKNGEKLVKAEEAVYLGNTLNTRANVTVEIDKQIQQVSITLWNLNAYWKASEASKKWQLLIFDAVIKSKLLYGMETVQMTEAAMKRVDAFQIKGLRKTRGKSTRSGIGRLRTRASWTKLTGLSARNKLQK